MRTMQVEDCTGTSAVGENLSIHSLCQNSYADGHNYRTKTYPLEGSSCRLHPAHYHHIHSCEHD